MAERIELLVTDKLEKAIQEIPEVDFISSTSKVGVSVIYVNIKEEYKNMRPIWDNLRRKIDGAVGDLPDDIRGPFVNDEFGLTAVATIALWSDGFSMAEMRLVARDVRDRLYELKGVRKVELYGVQDEQVTLKFSNAKLAQFGISTSDILRTLIRQNVILPGGSVDVEDKAVIILPTGNFRSIEDIENVLVAIPGSEQVVNLTEVVSVERGYADPPDNLAYFNNRAAIVISVSIIPGVNSVEFGERLTRKIRELESELPIGYVMDYCLLYTSPSPRDS